MLRRVIRLQQVTNQKTHSIGMGAVLSLLPLGQQPNFPKMLPCENVPQQLWQHIEQSRSLSWLITQAAPVGSVATSWIAIACSASWSRARNACYCHASSSASSALATAFRCNFDTPRSCLTSVCVLLPLGSYATFWVALLAVSPTSKVPCLAPRFLLGGRGFKLQVVFIDLHVLLAPCCIGAPNRHIGERGT